MMFEDIQYLRCIKTMINNKSVHEQIEIVENDQVVIPQEHSNFD
jgi:hypothetical protein